MLKYTNIMNGTRTHTLMTKPPELEYDALNHLAMHTDRPVCFAFARALQGHQGLSPWWRTHYGEISTVVNYYLSISIALGQWPRGMGAIASIAFVEYQAFNQFVKIFRVNNVPRSENPWPRRLGIPLITCLTRRVTRYRALTLTRKFTTVKEIWDLLYYVKG